MRRQIAITAVRAKFRTHSSFGASMQQNGKSASISVVIASYNDAGELSEAVGRYAGQSRAPDEIIVVVDGSTDESMEILEGLCPVYPRLRVIRHDSNKGVNAAIATGVKAATGDYVRIASTHDPVERRFLERMLHLMTRYPAAGIGFCDPGVVTGDGKKILYRLHLSHTEAFFSPLLFRRLLRRATFTIPSATTLFRREALIEVGGFDAALGRHADWYANLSCALRYGACYIPEHLALYLTHPDALGVASSGWNAEERRAASAILQRLREPENADLWGGFRYCGILPQMGIRPLLWAMAAGKAFVSGALVRHCLFESMWRLIRPYTPRSLRGIARWLSAVLSGRAAAASD